MTAIARYCTKFINQRVRYLCTKNIDHVVLNSFKNLQWNFVNHARYYISQRSSYLSFSRNWWKFLYVILCLLNRWIFLSKWKLANLWTLSINYVNYCNYPFRPNNNLLIWTNFSYHNTIFELVLATEETFRVLSL